MRLLRRRVGARRIGNTIGLLKDQVVGSVARTAQRAYDGLILNKAMLRIGYQAYKHQRAFHIIGWAGLGASLIAGLGYGLAESLDVSDQLIHSMHTQGNVEVLQEQLQEVRHTYTTLETVTKELTQTLDSLEETKSSLLEVAAEEGKVTAEDARRGVWGMVTDAVSSAKTLASEGASRARSAVETAQQKFSNLGLKDRPLYEAPAFDMGSEDTNIVSRVSAVAEKGNYLPLEQSQTSSPMLDGNGVNRNIGFIHEERIHGRDPVINLTPAVQPEQEFLAQVQSNVEALIKEAENKAQAYRTVASDLQESIANNTTSGSQQLWDQQQAVYASQGIAAVTAASSGAVAAVGFGSLGVRKLQRRLMNDTIVYTHNPHARSEQELRKKGYVRSDIVDEAPSFSQQKPEETSAPARIYKTTTRPQTGRTIGFAGMTGSLEPVYEEPAKDRYLTNNGIDRIAASGDGWEAYRSVEGNSSRDDRAEHLPIGGDGWGAYRATATSIHGAAKRSLEQKITNLERLYDLLHKGTNGSIGIHDIETVRQRLRTVEGTPVSRKTLQSYVVELNGMSHLRCQMGMHGIYALRETPESNLSNENVQSEQSYKHVSIV